MRVSRLKHLSSTMRFNAISDLRPSIPYASNSYHTRQLEDVQKNKQNCPGSVGSGSAISSQYLRGGHSVLCMSNSTLYRGSPFGVGVSPRGRFFSSASEATGNVPNATGTNLNPGGVGGDDWNEKLKQVWQSTVDAAKYTGDKAKEASDEAAPQVQLWLDAHPLLRDVLFPVGSTLTGTLLVWSLLPGLLRRFHRYSMQSPTALFRGSKLWVPVSYEKSIWGALESPIRGFITLAAFLQIGGMVAPTVVLSEFIGQATRGAFIISLVWFLHRWKRNTITRHLAAKTFESVERDELLFLDKISSAGLFVLGSMAVAEACGVAVQSILTVGGIGGVATAFAAKDVLGNFLSGLMVQSSSPFSIGDTIKAGSVEGQVVEVGLTATSLLTTEKFPATVPNSLFFSQVIVNKSRAKYRAVVKRIPLRTEDPEKITRISEDIKSMLRSNPHVFVEKDAPYCFLSQIERAYAELTLGCNLKHMNKDGEHDILIKALLIIKGHGVELGSTEDLTPN